MPTWPYRKWSTLAQWRVSPRSQLFLLSCYFLNMPDTLPLHLLCTCFHRWEWSSQQKNMTHSFTYFRSVLKCQIISELFFNKFPTPISLHYFPSQHLFSSNITYYVIGLLALFIVLLPATRIKAPWRLGYCLFCSLLYLQHLQ